MPMVDMVDMAKYIPSSKQHSYGKWPIYGYYGSTNSYPLVN